MNFWNIRTLKSLLLLGVGTTSPARADYLVIGVSGTLQDGFPLRDRLDYRSDSGETVVPAIFVGQALVRGYKAYLDIKDSECREYRSEPPPTVPNAVVLATGCREHANLYHIFAVDTRQYGHILTGEPRFLGITPDTGLVDLAASDPAVQRLAAQEMARQQGKMDTSTVAVPLVTGVWFQASSFVESPPIQRMDDGTNITSYDGGLALWAGVQRDDLVQEREEECRARSNGGECMVSDIIDKSKLAWEQVYRTIRQTEKDVYATDHPTSIPCQQRVRFGVSADQLRINYPLSWADINHAFRSSD